MSFRNEAVEAARTAGGSFKTIAARSGMMRQLADYLQKQNIQIRHISDLKEKHIAGWIKFGKDGGLKDRSLQNRLTAVRSVLRKIGLTKRVEGLQTEKFGIAGASRNGTRTGIGIESYQAKLANVDDKGVRAALQLQRVLGLRQREAVMARIDTLQRWDRELKEGGKIRILEGTKGGRPRDTLVIDRLEAVDAVRFALDVAGERHGHLIESRGLKEAIDRFNNVARGAGFVGKESPHSLRYAWARDSIKRYELHGLNRREALICTSLDLGHGDGRGRWVEQVYAR